MGGYIVVVWERGKSLEVGEMQLIISTITATTDKYLFSLQTQQLLAETHRYYTITTLSIHQPTPFILIHSSSAPSRPLNTTGIINVMNTVDNINVMNIIRTSKGSSFLHRFLKQG